MDAAEVVRAYWARTQGRDWDGVRALLADDLVVEWPVSGERFTSADAFVGMNAAYPEGWTIDVRSVVGDGEQVASQVLVPHVEHGPAAALSFWTVRGGLVRSAVEYWCTPGSERPPDWRKVFTV